MSIVIALIGIVNTLTLSIFERRREIGMVRALGMTEQQVGGMIRIEALLIAILGTVVGVVCGLLVGWAVVGGLGDVALNVEWGRIGLVVLAGVLVGLVASLSRPGAPVGSSCSRRCRRPDRHSASGR